MEKQTKYINELGAEVTIERRVYEAINTVEEDYSENGKLIHRTIFEGEVFQTLLYFAFSVDEINLLVGKHSTVSIIHRMWENGFLVEEYIQYVDKIIASKRIAVINSRGENICFRHVQFENGITKEVGTEKRYFKDGQEKYLFDYNSDGTCFMINNTQSFQEDIFPWDIGTDKTDFTWTGHEYYKFADPLVPEP